MIRFILLFEIFSFKFIQNNNLIINNEIIKINLFIFSILELLELQTIDWIIKNVHLQNYFACTIIAEALYLGGVYRKTKNKKHSIYFGELIFISAN